MADIFDTIDKLTKAHDYFGKAKALTSSITTVLDATKIDPHDVSALEKLVGLGDKETKKLYKTLNARASATEAAATASYPKVEYDTLKYWTKWAKALDTHGEGSKEAKSTRDNYLWALQQYDKKLEERIGYCGALIAVAGKQLKIYKNLLVIHERGIKVAKATLLIAPEGSAKTAAMAFLLKFTNLSSPIKRINRANNKIIANAKAERTRVQPIRKTNQSFITSMQKKNLNDLLKKALKAVGVTVPAG
ncbi:hypothetical protein [uncultured Tateyamaria sp.]|uniref:hypothetical protein n=1 Tax=uncultured Tateyamaria sp. TaxID=455651 RepID=UPI00260E0F59|nr:hypothetical protein [uncultured Tateyamaria sp.]